MKKTFLLLFVFLFSFSGTISAQKKNAKIPQKAFWIKSALNHNMTVGGCWDIPGKPKILKNGMNLAVWELGSGKDIDRMYTLVPVSKDYYRIIVGKVPKGANISNLYGVDILGNKKEKGANVGIWKSHGKDNQQFKFFHLGAGKFKIYTKQGKALSLANGSSKNGSSIQIWPDANLDSKIWYLIDPKTNKTFIPRGDFDGYETLEKGHGIYTLQSGEEFIFGKIGFKGSKQYTVTIIRKPNSNKEVYNFYGNYYAERPLGAKMKKNHNVKSYDKYDYYLIFNDKKFGPYDHVFSLGKSSNSNIDSWVSEDAKHISFVGTIGARWHSIIYNKKAISSWGPGGIENYDGLGNKWVYSKNMSKGVYKLFEQGKLTFQNSSTIEAPRYSKQGKLLYAARKEGGSYIYLNHKQIDGPFKQIANLHYGYQAIGFIHNTERIYYNTFKKVKLGRKEYICKEDETISGFEINDFIISFIVLNKKTRQNTVCEYNIRTEEMSSHGTYPGYLLIRNYNGNLYYVNNNIETKKYAVIGIGGKVLWKKQYVDSSPNCRMSPNGDLYGWYKENNVWKIEKNGKIIDFNGKIAGIAPITFNPVSGEPIIHSKIDKPIAGEKHQIKYGNLKFDVSGDLNAGMLRLTEDGNSIFYTIRTINNNNWTYKLYKNGQNVESKAYNGISNFTLSRSGDKYAMLVPNKQKVSYIILNEHMDVSWKMIFNGKELPGKYGAPVWSPKHNVIIALKQVGKSIVIEKLD